MDAVVRRTKISAVKKLIFMFVVLWRIENNYVNIFKSYSDWDEV